MKDTEDKKNNMCPYCGDAFVNHPFLYLSNTIGTVVDPFLHWSTKHTPRFVKSFMDLFLKFIFKSLIFFQMGRFSDDIEKVVSLRSRVIWEEAKQRGLKVEQFIVFGKPTEHFRVKINGKYFQYESLPVPPWFAENVEDWDNKFILKNKLSEGGVPVPRYNKIPIGREASVKKLFESFEKPIIVKPIVGSRGRHTTTNIFTLEEFNRAIKVGKTITPRLVAEEHLTGYVCRATLVAGKLAGFYRAEPPSITGDGTKTISLLIKEKDKNRPDRVSPVPLGKEIEEYVGRLGFNIASILPKDHKIHLTHRTGRYFGGKTKEMLNGLHPSFVPILEKASKITNLPVVGFDCIVPDPEKDEKSQKWGIIECNTLPFIDLHYFALEGKPGNIAGQVWDLWNL